MDKLQEIELDLGLLIQLAMALIIILFVFVYKIIQKALQHKQIMAAIEKGLDISDFNFGKSPKHVRSFYLSAGFAVMSIPCVLILIDLAQKGELNNRVLFASAGLVAAAAIFLVRGILLRRVYIKSLALKNGVPFDSLYFVKSIRFKGILPIAVGFPLAVVFTAIFCVACLIQRGKGGVDEKLILVVTALMLTGQVLFLRGIMVRRAVKKQLKASSLRSCQAKRIELQETSAVQ